MAENLLKLGSRVEDHQNGKNTLFWRDWWIGDFPFLVATTQQISDIDSFKLVKDLLEK